MQLIAIHTATTQTNHACISPLCVCCRCQLRMLHDHANELTKTQTIHVPTDHETGHCTQVFLNAYRKNFTCALCLDKIALKQQILKLLSFSVVTNATYMERLYSCRMSANQTPQLSIHNAIFAHP
jgi:hypothetical protein